MKRNALITWGGEEGHEPEKGAALFCKLLEADGMAVEVVNTLSCFDDVEYLKTLDLIVPLWTMRTLTRERSENVSEALAEGTGLAGCHGQMCDAFRDNVLWQFITGGNFVGHPHGDGQQYRVRITESEHELVAGIGDFDVISEQYYLHVDPAVHVLAVTTFPTRDWYHSPNGRVDMPVVWTKRWGLGRVYYNSLGHKVNVIDHGQPLEMLRRGLIWASHGREAAMAAGENHLDLAAPGNHY